MKKRIISLLLALVMVFGVLPVTALANGNDVVEQPAIVETKEEEGKEEPNAEEKEEEITPPNSQNEENIASDEEEEDTENEEEINEAAMFAAPEQVVAYSADEDRDGKYLIFSRAKGTYVMAAKTNAQLEDTLKSSADPSLYKFRLEKLSKTIPIDNVAYHVYHVSITINNTKYYLTTNGSSGTIGIKSNSNQAAEFLIRRADVYAAQGGGKLEETRLCLFHVAYNDSNTAYGEAVEYETTHQSEHPGQGSYTLKLCSQNTADYGKKEGWDVCVDAYDLETENAIVTPKTAKVTVTKVFSNMDAEDIPTNFEVKLVSTSKTYNLTREGTSGYTYSATVEEGSYKVEEDKFTNDKYYHLSTKLEEEVSSSKTEIQPNQGEFHIEVKENEDRTFTLTNTYTKKAEPKATSATKEVVLESGKSSLPQDITTNGITFPKNTTDKLLVTTDSVTLLYKITVTGDKGAKFTVSDPDTTLVYPTGEGAAVTTKSSGVYEGTLPTESATDKASLEFYVTKTFDTTDNSGELKNEIELDDKKQDNPPTVPYEKNALVTITKEFTGNLPTEQQPTIKIKLKYTDSNNTVQYIELTKGQDLTYTGRVPAGTYTVVETNSNDEAPDVQHYNRTTTLATPNEGTDFDITVANGQTYTYTLTNNYTKTSATDLKFSLNGYIVKTLDADAPLPDAKTFSVKAKIKGTENNEKTGTTAYKTSFSNEPFVFADADKFSINSETIFEIKEVQGTAVDGLTYNDKTYELKVTVKVDDDTNAYVVNKVYWHEAGAADWTELGTNDKLVINNEYEPPITTGTVTITKVVEGGFTLPSNFGIKLVPTEEGKDEVILNLKNGTSDKYEATDIPAGEYTVVEENYTDTTGKYKFVSKKLGDSTTNFKINVVAKSEQNLTLTNTYKENEKTSAKVNFSDLIRKELTIKGDYSFTGATFYAKLHYVTAKPYSLISSTDTTYDLKAVFDKYDKSGATTDFVKTTGGDLEIEFPAAGSYRFWLYEVNEGKSGVTYDKSIYRLIVTIKAEGDKLVLDEIEYSKWNNGNPAGEADKNGYVTKRDPITFYNTANTGKKGDHIKIDSPNKLNTDDHYAYIIGYPDGTVQPGGEITRAEVATIFFRLLKDDVRDKYFTKTNDFSDVNRNDWFNNPVSTMAELGIVKGYPDGTFRPNEPITRAEFAAIAARFDESSRYGETRFTDVAGHWAIREIAKAYNNGWIKGYPDNTFRPNRNITRAEAMTLINRVLNRAPETEKDLLNNMNKWSDNMDVDAWYYLAVQEATNSHDYRRKTSSYEHWIRMLEDPNWAKYER